MGKTLRKIVLAGLTVLVSYAPMSYASFKNPESITYKNVLSDSLKEKIVRETIPPAEEEVPYEPLGDFREPHYEWNTDTGQWELFPGEEPKVTPERP